MRIKIAAFAATTLAAVALSTAAQAGVVHCDAEGNKQKNGAVIGKTGIDEDKTGLGFNQVSINAPQVDGFNLLRHISLLTGTSIVYRLFYGAMFHKNTAW